MSRQPKRSRRWGAAERRRAIPIRPRPSAPGLARIEILLFLFGVIAFAVLMLIFGQGLPGDAYLPLVAGWVVLGVTFVWWFDRRLRRS